MSRSLARQSLARSTLLAPVVSPVRCEASRMPSGSPEPTAHEGCACTRPVAARRSTGMPVNPWPAMTTEASSMGPVDMARVQPSAMKNGGIGILGPPRSARPLEADTGTAPPGPCSQRRLLCGFNAAEAGGSQSPRRIIKVPRRDGRSRKGTVVKRLISVTVGVLLGVSLWSGPALAESSQQGDDVQLVAAATNPFAGVFSQVQSTLSQGRGRLQSTPRLARRDRRAAGRARGGPGAVVRRTLHRDLPDV